MNWEAIQALAELVAAVAVVGSLGYLAVQIRQNTVSVQASTVARASETMNRLRSSVWTDPESARIYLLALSGEPTTDLADGARARMFFAAIGRDYEALYYQYRAGQLPEEIWTGWRDEMLLIFGTPGGRDAVEGLRAGYLTADFYNFLRAQVDLLEDSPIARLRATWDEVSRARRETQGRG